MSSRRPLVLAALTAVVSLGLIAAAVRYGWLGADVDRGADFCEAAAGRVRQPVNTLSNLGFVVAGLLIARDADRLPVVGTAYACLVVFLGGLAWFLTHGGFKDQRETSPYYDVAPGGPVEPAGEPPVGSLVEDGTVEDGTVEDGTVEKEEVGVDGEPDR